ncbi:MAG: hypothetical protein ACTSWN_14585 [Promethearchaeota archaeon]
MLKICPYCKGENPNDANFCQYCGIKFPKNMLIVKQKETKPVSESTPPLANQAKQRENLLGQRSSRGLNADGKVVSGNGDQGTPERYSRTSGFQSGPPRVSNPRSGPSTFSGPASPCSPRPHFSNPRIGYPPGPGYSVHSNSPAYPPYSPQPPRCTPYQPPYHQNYPIPPRYPNAPYKPFKEKEPALAAILSVFIPGAGQMYAGKVGKGILILVLTIVTSFIIVGFVIWIWNIFDAYSMAKRYNEEYLITGMPPW